MSPFVFVAFSIIGNIVGQLMLKNGMSLIAQRPGKSVPIGMVTSPWVVGGMIAYGTGVLFWTLALSYLQLSYVYPFGTLGYIGIIIGSYFFFKESISRLRLVGIAILISGLLLVSFS